MPITQAKDLMYGGSLKTPATAPNDAVISGNGTFTISNWTGTLPKGGATMLFIRQWTNGVGSTVLYQCWDGQTIWQYGLNGSAAWGVVGTVGGSPTWSNSLFSVNGTTQWSIIPQTGVAGDPSGATDQNFDCAITAVPGLKTGNNQPFTVTFPNVSNGAGGTGTVSITIIVQAPPTM